MTAAVDPFASYVSSPIGPANDAVAVTPSDTVNYATMARALYVGSDAGNVVVVTAAGTVVTFTGVKIGTIIPLRHSRVNATSTTSTNLVALI